MSHASEHHQLKALPIWLFFSAFMVFAMMVIGAITRLTESGLSMVEWRPLIGALPPMDEAEWQRVFELYQQSPEYKHKNSWMGIDDFKNIFFWEWFHRLWGRLIGVVFALPLIWFWIRGVIPGGYRLKMLGMLVLGGLQGLMGWYMVKSGLVDNPAVSHYRLAAHLSLAMLIMALLIWLGLSLAGAKRTAHSVLYKHGWAVLFVLTFTIFWGAFTAGLDAGLLYNDSFPAMGGGWLPPDINQLEPFGLNFLENPSGVQFMHRWLAITAVLAALSFWANGILKGAAFPLLHALGGMALVQFLLGLATLFSGVNIHTAAAHQAGAAILLGLLVACLHRLKP